MVLEIIGIMLAVIILSIIINGVESYCKQKKREDMSFREAMDLVELPVVTFYNKDTKLNFLLDTGSDLSYINKSILPSLDYKEIDESRNIISVGGNSQSLGCCNMTVTYRNQKFIDRFYVSDLDEAFGAIKAETGAQIHGILGSKFFAKYKYILDFESLIAYSKK
jgi:hypothetical protein